jgi:hypothetical protein
MHHRRFSISGQRNVALARGMSLAISDRQTIDGAHVSHDDIAKKDSP